MTQYSPLIAKDRQDTYPTTWLFIFWNIAASY